MPVRYCGVIINYFCLLSSISSMPLVHHTYVYNTRTILGPLNGPPHPPPFHCYFFLFFASSDHPKFRRVTYKNVSNTCLPYTRRWERSHQHTALSSSFFLSFLSFDFSEITSVRLLSLCKRVPTLIRNESNRCKPRRSSRRSVFAFSSRKRPKGTERVLSVNRHRYLERGMAVQSSYDRQCDISIL